jgi:hypothetical protein
MPNSIWLFSIASTTTITQQTNSPVNMLTFAAIDLYPFGPRTQYLC